MSARPESPGERFTDWAARLFDPAARHAKPEALRGIRVLGLSVIIFGPATADFLGELGAEVVKVEMPGQGDVTRILGHEISAWSVNYTASEILAKVLADPGPGTIVFGPVNRPTQTLAEDHWWERGCFARLDDPVYGPLTLAAPAWRMTRTPPRLKIPGRPAGFHTAHVYARHLGLGPSRLAELRVRGII